MAKIFLVEDDAELARKVADWLKLEHHNVEHCDRGREALDRIRACAYDLIILDWELPELTGIEILKEYRSHRGTTPVLMLTGHDTVQDKESGLDTGADDYLTKPFHLRELSARVKALVRRHGAQYDTVLRTKSLTLDTQSKRVTKDGEEIKLQPQELALLEFFLRNPKDVFSVDALFARVWPSDLEASPDTVRVCITRLRNKIDKPGQSSVIKTVHRLGYQVDLEA